MQKDKNRKRAIKLMRIFKKKRETKEKQILKKENKKGWCSKTREILKRKLFFKKKKERKASVQRHAIFCFLKQKTDKKITRPEVQMLSNTCF